MQRGFLACLLALGTLLAGACGDDRGPAPAAEAPAVTPAVTPDSLEAFRARMEELVRTCATGSEVEAVRNVVDVMLPEPKPWFQSVFGDANFEALEAEYLLWKLRVRELPAEVKRTLARGETELLTERFDRSGDELSTTFQSIALRKMKHKTALYSLRLVAPGKDEGWHLWSFAWVDGKFRFVGRMLALTPIATDPDLVNRGSLRIKTEREVRLGK